MRRKTEPGELLKQEKTPNGTKAGKMHMKRVSSLFCCVCHSPPPNDAHHIKNNTGMALKSSDFETIPLCSKCHYDFHHGIGKKAWEDRHGLQVEHLKRTLELLDM